MLVYSQRIERPGIGHSCWVLTGTYTGRGRRTPFERGVLCRARAAVRYLADNAEFFSPALTTALVVPEWAEPAKEALAQQRRGMAAFHDSLVERGNELHAKMGQGWRNGLEPQPALAWRGLPVVEFLRATGLDTADFTLVDLELWRLQWRALRDRTTTLA